MIFEISNLRTELREDMLAKDAMDIGTKDRGVALLEANMDKS